MPVQDIAQEIFRCVDPEITYKVLISDGKPISAGTDAAEINGNSRSILAAERIALNFLQQLSGVATQTNSFVTKILHTNCRLIDTRKTIPGWRMLQKYAVLMGGGHNHRCNLGDGILIKDNHIAAVGSVTEAVQKALSSARHPLRIEIEVKNHAEAIEAVDAGAECLLLDNMTPQQVKKIVDELGSKVLLEASGNMNLETVAKYAETGINFISVGALTHSANALDLSLNFD